MFRRNLLTIIFSLLFVVGCGSSGNDDKTEENEPQLEKVTVQVGGQPVETIALEEGESATVSALAEFDNGESQSADAVVWASDNTDIVEITATGLILAKAAGSANITATISETIAQTISITVTAKPVIEDPVIEEPANQSPIANAGANQVINVGSTVTIDGSASADPDGDTLAYSWSTGQTTASFTQDFQTVGEFSFELTVTDADGASNTATVTITVEAVEVPNETPTAIISGDETLNVVVGDEVSFDGSTSTDSDGDIVSYNWSFGADTAAATTIFDAAGEFTITLTVTDDQGASSSDTITVTVEEKEIVTTIDAAYIAGTFNEWEWQSLTLSADNTWTTEVTFAAATEAAGNPRFKFSTTGMWEDGDLGDTNDDGVLELDTAEDGDIEVRVAGKYLITFNSADVEAFSYTTELLEAAEEEEQEENEEEQEETAETTGYIAGTFNEWMFTAMTATDDANIWTYTVEVAQPAEDEEVSPAAFKFNTTNIWDENELGDTDGDFALELNTPELGNISIEEAGTFIVTLDLSDEEAPSYSITPAEQQEEENEEEESTTTAYIAGSFTGWALTEMEASEQPAIWTFAATVTAPEEGEEPTDIGFKFNTASEWDGNELGASETEGELAIGGGNINIDAGTYVITLDLTNADAPTYSFESSEQQEEENEEEESTTTAYIAGSFTGWALIEMEADEQANIWTFEATVTASEEGEEPSDIGFKFNTADDWDGNELGAAETEGELAIGGGNISIEVGTYLITLDLSDAEAPKYSVTEVVIEEATITTGIATTSTSVVEFAINDSDIDTIDSDRVVLAGSFNAWNTSADNWSLELTDGVWHLTKAKQDVMIPGGSSYPEFKVVIVHVESEPTWLDAADSAPEEFRFPDGLGANNHVVLDLDDNADDVIAVSTDALTLLAEDATDAQVANFRSVTAANIASSTIYRGVNPLIDPMSERGDIAELARNVASADLMTLSGINSVINLSQSLNDLEEIDILPEYKARIDSGLVLFAPMTHNEVYYENGSTEFAAKLANVINFISSTDGPYFVHDSQSSHQTGVVIAVLSALAGASWDEISVDYVTSNDAKMTGYVSEELLAYALSSLLSVDATTVDLQSAVENYLSDNTDLTDTVISDVKAKLDNN